MGVVASFLSECFPPASKFTVDDIPDLSGKVIIVTGANTGVGWQTAKALLLHNAKVYVAARSTEKATAAIAELKIATGKDAIFLKLDLANLTSVRAAAEEFLSKESELHVLFNNGGVMIPPVEQLTADGYDLQFGTNVLGHYYFTRLLLPALLAATKSSADGKARVINTSSSTQAFTGLDFNTFKDGPARRAKGTQMLYAQSKHGNVVLSAELARRYGDLGLVSTSCNPGNLASDLQRNMSSLEWALTGWMHHPVEFGALTQLYAGTSPEGKDFNGKYLVPWARFGSPRTDTQDPQIGKELWTWLEEQTKDI